MKRQFLYLIMLFGFVLSVFGGFAILGQENCSTRQSIRYVLGLPHDLNSVAGRTSCFSITDIPSNINMLQLQVHLESGSFDAYYRTPQSDWLSLTLERAEDANIYTFLPFTFGADSIEVSIEFFSSTQATMNVASTEFVSVDPTPQPSGSSSSNGMTSLPGRGLVSILELERFFEYRIPVPVFCAGTVRATVSWTGGSTAVAVFLKGSNRNGFYEQENGSTPVTLSYNVTLTDLQRSQVWQLWLVNFDSNDARDVEVNYSTPDCGNPISSNNAGSMHQLASMNDHLAGVTAVAFSPDGTRIVSGSDDDSLILWDVASRSMIRRMSGHDGSIESVAYAPDARTIVSGGHDNVMILWSASTGSIIRRYIGHSNIVESVAYSPDGNFLLSGSADASMILWDKNSGSILQRFNGHSGGVEGVAYSSQGNRVVSASLDGTANVWNPNNGNLRTNLTSHTDEVESVAFSPNGNQFVTASADHTLILWDTNSGNVIRQFTGHSDSVEAVAFSPTGQIFASSAQDNTIRIWSVSSSNAIAILTGHSDRIDSIAFSPNGNLLVSASMDGTVRLWGFNGNQ